MTQTLNFTDFLEAVREHFCITLDSSDRIRYISEFMAITERLRRRCSSLSFLFFQLTTVATPDDDGNCQLTNAADSVSVVRDSVGVDGDSGGGTLMGYLGSRRPIEAAQRRLVASIPMPIGDAAAMECGSERMPWLVTVKPGQRIRIAVMDFTAPAVLESEEEIDEVYRRSTKRRGRNA